MEEPAEQVAAEPSAERAFQVRFGGALAQMLRVALEGASERLGREPCPSIFSLFHDQAGRPLQERLDRLGYTGQAYLGEVVFADGSARGCCHRGLRPRLAVTAPGGRVVFVCTQVFRDSYVRNPAYVEATLIHEMLHTLGLGENPPASAEITARVREQCDRAAPSGARRSDRGPHPNG